MEFFEAPKAWSATFSWSINQLGGTPSQWSEHISQGTSNHGKLILFVISISQRLWIARRVPHGNIPITQASLSQYPVQSISHWIFAGISVGQPTWNIVPVARRKNPRGIGWRFFCCYCVCLNYIVGSRHLVFNWGLLGNPNVLVLSEIRG